VSSGQVPDVWRYDVVWLRPACRPGAARRTEGPALPVWLVGPQARPVVRPVPAAL